MQNQEIKIYANAESAIIEDKSIVDRYKSFLTNAPLFADSVEFKAEYFAFCNDVRQLLGGVSNVLSFLPNNAGTSLLIFIYDVFANEGKSYRHGIDEKGSYMVLMQGQLQ
jgi:hypothetical protein